jgi:hypothetical protein
LGQLVAFRRADLPLDERLDRAEPLIVMRSLFGDVLPNMEQTRLYIRSGHVAPILHRPEKPAAEIQEGNLGIRSRHRKTELFEHNPLDLSRVHDGDAEGGGEFIGLAPFQPVGLQCRSRRIGRIFEEAEARPHVAVAHDMLNRAGRGPQARHGAGKERFTRSCPE